MPPEAFAPIQLPIGHFEMTPTLDDSIRESCGARARSGDDAHPILGFVSALGGAGLRVAEVLALCDCSIEDGPVLATCDLAIPRPLKVGRVYQVSGEVSSRERKPSRRFGAADHLDLRFDLTHHGDNCGSLNLRMIVPSR